MGRPKKTEEISNYLQVEISYSRESEMEAAGEGDYSHANIYKKWKESLIGAMALLPALTIKKEEKIE